MAAIRRAEAVWEGDLMTGRGAVSSKSSGLFQAAPITWASRTESADGRTSPEELLAAAHASCFAMALSHALAQAKTPARKLEVSATVKFDKTPAGFRVVSSALEVTGWVPEIDAAGFEKAASGAKDNCPISQALKNNVELSVQAKLARA
jgi:osmotically inducible protein OsmC